MIRGSLIAAFLWLSPPIPAQEAPQDRAELSGPVESWYKVVQGNRNVGFVHESIERVPTTEGVARYIYARVSDFILTEPDEKVPSRELDHAEATQISGVLDDSWTPLVLFLSFLVDGRTREIRLDEGMLPKESDLQALPSLLFYSLRQRSQLSKPGRRTAKLLNLRAESLEGVATTFEVSALARTEFAGRAVPLTRIAFQKPPPALFSHAQVLSASVDKFGRMVETTLQGGAQILLVSGEEEAFAQAVNPHRSGLNEPFDKARALAKRIRDLGEFGAPHPSRADVNPSNVETKLKEAREILNELRRRKEGDSTEDLRGPYLLFLSLWSRMRELRQEEGSSELGKALERLRDEAEALYDGTRRALGEARDTYIQAGALAERDQTEAAKGKLFRLQSYLERLELVGRPERKMVEGWVYEVKGLVQRLTIRQELARKPLAVTAITTAWVPESRALDLSVPVFGHRAGQAMSVRFSRDASMAVINGVVYRTGERVEPEGVVVDRITSHGIEVSWRGERREIPLGSR